MCNECGCGAVGSSTGITSVNIIDKTEQGNSGVTLNMTANSEQRERFIKE